MYNREEIRIANQTCRVSGASARNKDGSLRSIVPKYIYEHIDRNESILDYGSGTAAIHTVWLKNNGFNNVTAYDFGANCKEGLHDKDALSKQYKVIMCSNVLNVQSSLQMLLETLKQICNSLEPGGVFIANYPASPRKSLLSAQDVAEVIENLFNNKVERVGGSKSAPLWRITKPFAN